MDANADFDAYPELTLFHTGVQPSLLSLEDLEKCVDNVRFELECLMDENAEDPNELFKAADECEPLSLVSFHSGSFLIL